MESDAYRVQILHYLNPHLIWVEIFPDDDAAKKSVDVIFEQVGVYGILPLEASLDFSQERLTTRESLFWAPAVVPLMKQMLSEADKIWFSPTYIDRRSSIFDNNIHKYGELYIITKNNQLQKLSQMLVKTSFARYDEATFHKELFSFRLKTNLDKDETQKVVKALEKATSTNNKNYHEESLKKQTTVYQEAEKIKSLLTTDNLDRHNKGILNYAKNPGMDSIINSKYEDLKLCKGIDEESVGCGVLWSKMSDNNTQDPFDLLIETKKKLLHNAKNNTPRSDSTNQLRKNNNSEGTENRSNRNHSSENYWGKDCFYQNTTSPVQKEDENKNTEISPNTYNYVKIKKGRKKPSNQTQIPEFNENTHKLVTMGPPEVDHQQLGHKIIPKYQIPSKPVEREAENCEEEKEENNLAGLDSEVNFAVTSNLKISPNIIKKPTLNASTPNAEESDVNVLKNKVNYSILAQKALKKTSATAVKAEVIKLTPNDSLAPSVSDNESKSPYGLRKYIQSKLQKSRTQNSDVTSSTDTDTSVKDTSSSDSHLKQPYNKNEDSDNETTMSEIVKRLDFEPTPPPKGQVKEKEIYNEENHVNPFQNIDFSLSKFVDKLVSPILMVHSKNDSRIVPTNQLRDVPFNSNIFVGLANVNVKHPTMIQKVSWLTILRGHSLFMISPMNSGKTVGYTPAVCRLVADFDETSVEQSLGPICIILCATSVSVSQVEKQCRKFLGTTKKVLSCFSGVNETDVITSLLNGCDVLICTPPALLRLLKVVNYAVDLRRLNTFVLDDCERLGLVYLNEIKYFNLKIKEMLKSRANKDLKVQYIVASRIWCDFMDALAKNAPNPVVCIGAYQECVLYSKSNMSVVFAKKENKINVVTEFLESVDKSKNTVIVCRNDEEVNEILKVVKKLGRHVFAADRNMTVEGLYTLSSNWAEYDEPLLGAVLVCCDDNLLHLNVTNAHNLLQYSLPSLFSMFSRRYAVLTDYYPSIFKTRNDEVKIKIILEAENVEQLPKIAHFLKRCNSNLPSSLGEACENILREKDFDRAKRFVPICENVLSLGECPDIWYCMERRHSIFNETDTPSEEMPKSGVVTFKILHYHSAVEYSARLLSHISNGKTRKFPSNYSNVSMSLGLHYSQESNRTPLGIAKVGEICSVSTSEHYFRRCQVVKIISTYEKNGNPDRILVKLIDEEKLEITKDIYLFHLPDKLRNVNCYVSKVILANIQPKDRDITFSNISMNHLKKVTDKCDDLYMRGRVAMTIGNCIIVDVLEACQDLSSSRETVVRYNYKSELLKHYAQPNTEHLPKLEKLCAAGGLEIKANILIEEKEVEPECVIEMPKPRWAHLDDDLQLVYFASADNPDKFFVRLEKFEDCLDLLTIEIQKYIAEETTVAVKEVNKDHIVLAKFPDDSLYYRARIDAIVDKNKSKCFFVDHGDWRDVHNKDVVPITEKHITQMPFQAIECRLLGVKPFSNQWTDYSTNYFCDQCFVGSSDKLKKLYVKYFTKEESESTGGHKYGIVLIDTNTEVDVVINKTMLDHNMAQENPEEIQYLDNFNFKRKESPKKVYDDDWECEPYECKPVELYQTNADSSKYPISIFDKPIRSVPLVPSDDDFDNWDVAFSDDDLDCVLKNSKILNDKKDMNKFLALEGNETQKAEETSTCSSLSKISDFEIIKTPKAKITELDSDDFTSPDDLTSPDDKTSQTFNAGTLNDTPINQINEVRTLRKPKLCWRQTKNTVTIRIELIGVEEYKLVLSEKHITFNCEVLDTQYGFDFELYGVIEPSKSSHQPKGLYVFVKLVKLLTRTWLTLQKDSLIRKWIVYDADSLEMSSDDEDEEDLKKKDFKMIVEKAHYDNSDDEMEDDNFHGDVLFDRKIGYESD